MTGEQDKFLSLLIKNEVISEEQLNAIGEEMQESGKNIEDILIENKILDLEAIVKLKAEIANIEYYDLRDKVISENSLNVIPIKVAENYKIGCFEKNENNIKVGLIDPYNSNAIQAVNFLVKEQGLHVDYFLVSEDSLKKLFGQYRNLEKEITTALDIKTQESGEMIDAQVQEVRDDGANNVSTAPVSKIVSVIIRHAVEEKASDIHIEPMSKETRVRYRVDGMLRTSLVLPKSIHSAVVGRIKVLAKLKIDETRIPQDGRIRLIINKKEVDFRISIMPLMGQEKVVMRILDLGKGVPSLGDLGYEHRALEVILTNLKKTFGVLLVTGPTGSGKSTTLASVLSLINKEDINLATLEDPVEYFVKGANQSQVNPSINYTFAGGLRALLRQDPDVIMVGEVRDNETAELCVNAGLTGHYVVSTLHTNTAVDAIPRLLDMDVEPFLLGSTLNTVIAQRLARKICQNCKRKAENVTPEMIAQVKKEIKRVPENVILERVEGLKSIEDLNENFFYEGAGCVRCKDTGYAGRIAVVEVIDVTEGISRNILDSDKMLTEDFVREDQAYTSMKEDGIIKALQGKTTVQEVLRVIQD